MSEARDLAARVRAAVRGAHAGLHGAVAAARRGWRRWSPHLRVALVSAGRALTWAGRAVRGAFARRRGEGSTAFESMERIALTGALVVVAFFGVLGGWAAFASLESAALAPAVLGVEGQRKTIQHLEGGIVAEILVRDGERVRAGQPLLRLDPTQVRATLEQLRARHLAALALKARLVAERDGRDAVSFPSELRSALSRPKVAEAVNGERAIFVARRRSIDARAAILAQRVVQLEQEIVGLRGQIAAETTQIELIGEETRAQETLRRDKLIGMQRLLELKREAAELEGSRSRNVAAIARVEQSIAEERLKILELATSRTKEVVEQLRETEAMLADLDERIAAAADVLARTRIDSPLDGVIVDLDVHTIGGVVAPGEALMDIVPVDGRLVIEARVTPEDIDSVHPGLTAQVVVTAFNRRTVPPLDGRVTSVSADRLTDNRTGLPYFLARIVLPDERPPAYTDLQLYPGMQAEVMIVTGERSPLGYIFRPVVRSFDRALRED